MARSADALATGDEVAEALRSLSKADALRLEHFAKMRTAGVPWLDWADLLQEAVRRALACDRRWPKSVAFVVFMRETIRSIAHEEVRQRAEGPVSVEADLVAQTDEVADVVDSHADPAPGLERDVIAQEALETILRAFADDSVALAAIRGLAEGATPQDICEREGVTRTALESAQKRVRRRIAALAGRGDKDD